MISVFIMNIIQSFKGFVQHITYNIIIITLTYYSILSGSLCKQNLCFLDKRISLVHLVYAWKSKAMNPIEMLSFEMIFYKIHDLDFNFSTHLIKSVWCNRPLYFYLFFWFLCLLVQSGILFCYLVMLNWVCTVRIPQPTMWLKYWGSRSVLQSHCLTCWTPFTQ